MYKVNGMYRVYIGLGVVRSKYRGGGTYLYSAVTLRSVIDSGLTMRSKGIWPSSSSLLPLPSSHWLSSTTNARPPVMPAPKLLPVRPKHTIVPAVYTYITFKYYEIIYSNNIYNVTYTII